MSERQTQRESELVEFIRSIDVDAPDALHQRIAAIAAANAHDERPRPRRIVAGLRWRAPSRARPALLACAFAVALVVVLALALRSGSSASRSPVLALARAAALSSSPASEAAPSQDTRDRQRLSVAENGVAFPYWADAFGWRATGTRRDVLDGYASTTVFYASAHHATIAYTILGARSASALSSSPGRTVWRAGGAYHLLELSGVRVVAWLRHSSACVLSARSASYATLLRLASSSV